MYNNIVASRVMKSYPSGLPLQSVGHDPCRVDHPWARILCTWYEKKSSKQLAIIKFNHEKLQLGCLLLSAIKFKDMGKQLASLLKEYFVVLQVTYRTHAPPPPLPQIWK